MTFDTYRLGRNTETYIPYEKSVKEIRAPTDESIRIYEEMKEKAFKSILDTVVTTDNIVNYKYQIYKDVYSFNTILYFSISLNGKEFQDKIILDWGIEDKRKAREEIYKKASAIISYKLLESIRF